MKHISFFIVMALISATALTSSCGSGKNKNETANDSTKVDSMKQKVDQYAEVTLTTDLSKLTDKEKQMISIFIEVAEIMDELFWMQTYGDKNELLGKIKDENTRRFVMINYGPWDHLNGNLSFVDGYGVRPPGNTYYPLDMDTTEFKALNDPNKKSLYTVIRRGDDGKLQVVWYHDAYKDLLKKASDLLKKAAELAEDPGLKKYLELRAEALMTSNYQASDFAWMEMKNSNIDFVVGPIENYDDALFGYKAAFEACILVKDIEWSAKLERFAKLLPELQKQLPVDEKYKRETPGADSDMNVYDIIYYAGDCNAGSKTIAINLPNDEDVQLQKGTRKLQLKNTMQAKFDKILKPIANILIDPAQLKYVKFDAFFNNVMFHEVAHGLGIKNTITGKGPVRQALESYYSSIEEGKADIVGLFLVTKLREMGEIKEGEIKDNYVSFVAGIFRSVRFGSASAHGKANMMCFVHLMKEGAVVRNAKGYYTVVFEKMPAAVESLAAKIITIEGDGNLNAAKSWIEKDGNISAELQADLDRLETANIPVDIIFKQGKQVLGL